MDKKIRNSTKGDSQLIMSERLRIGSRITEIRKEMGLSTYKLAELTGINQPNIVRIEKGTHSVGIDQLNKIAGVLGVEIDFIQKQNQ